MSGKVWALVLGGIAPAVLLGLSSVFQKLSNGSGMATGPFLVGAGLTSAVVGAAFALIERDSQTSPAGRVYTALFGVVWALGIGGIGLAIRRYGAPISQLVPLYNMNTLVAVLVGLVALGEWRTISPPRILLAAVLIIAGGILAARS